MIKEVIVLLSNLLYLSSIVYSFLWLFISTLLVFGYIYIFPSNNPVIIYISFWNIFLTINLYSTFPWISLEKGNSFLAEISFIEIDFKSLFSWITNFFSIKLLSIINISSDEEFFILKYNTFLNPESNFISWKISSNGLTVFKIICSYNLFLSLLHFLSKTLVGFTPISNSLILYSFSSLFFSSSSGFNLKSITPSYEKGKKIFPISCAVFPRWLIPKTKSIQELIFKSEHSNIFRYFSTKKYGLFKHHIGIITSLISVFWEKPKFKSLIFINNSGKVKKSGIISLKSPFSLVTEVIVLWKSTNNLSPQSNPLPCISIEVKE